MPRIPAQLTPGEADTLGAAVALLERLGAAQDAELRLELSVWDGMARGRAQYEFGRAAAAVTHSLITCSVTGDCPEAKRVLDAMDAADEPTLAAKGQA